MGDSPRAYVAEVDGQTVLVDPDAVTVMRVVGKHNCRTTLDLNAERVTHFARRLQELGKTPADAVIVVISVDDANGGPLADVLMPGTDWQAIRDRGEAPFARGLAMREGIQEALGFFDPEAAEKLREWEGVAVVVVDHGVAEIFPA